MSPFKVFALVVALGCAGGSAHAAQRQWSLGGSFGAGIYSGGSLNDSLKAIGFKEVTQGREYGGSIRYGISPRLSVDCEVLALRGKGTTDSVSPEFVSETNGIAAPLSLYYQLSENGAYAFSVFGGAGPLFKFRWSARQAPNEFKGRSKTALYAHAGFEGQLKAGPRFAVSMRALGRIARASDLEQEDDPATRFSVSLSGFALSVGLRASLGRVDD